MPDFLFFICNKLKFYVYIQAERLIRQPKTKRHNIYDIWRSIMGKKTKLQGFYQGASQIADFMKGEVITKETYLKEHASISKKVNNLDLNSPEGKK